MGGEGVAYGEGLYILPTSGIVNCDAYVCVCVYVYYVCLLLCVFSTVYVFAPCLYFMCLDVWLLLIYLQWYFIHVHLCV